MTNNSTGGKQNVIGGVMVMMVSDSTGQWTGDVICDDARCNKWLSQEKIKRRGLLERGWQCVLRMHHCPDHHKTVQWFSTRFDEDVSKYVEAWDTRQSDWRRSQGLLPLDPPAMPDTPIERKEHASIDPS